MTRRRKVILIVLVASLLVGVAVWTLVVKPAAEGIRNAYAVWWGSDMVIEHMETNGGAWPTCWDDLRDDYQTCVDTAGQPWTFEELRGRLVIDWSADPAELAKAHEKPDGPPFRAIWLQNGPSTHWSGREPNQMILDYLRHKQREATDATLHAKLRDFVAEDGFTPAAGSVYPEPKTAPAEILAYAARRYDADGDVRRLVALYFLRYDSALLDRGLITASPEAQNLIGLLWEKEAQGWAETPSAERMREHIATSAERLGLEAPEMELLQSNRSKSAKLVDTWREGTRP
jgi:hypothetical protein